MNISVLVGHTTVHWCVNTSGKSIRQYHRTHISIALKQKKEEHKTNLCKKTKHGYMQFQSRCIWNKIKDKKTN